MEDEDNGNLAYRPMMPSGQARQLNARHQAVVAAARRAESVTVALFGYTFVVPPEVFPPNRFGLAELLEHEVASGDRVLDMGTGSGVNGIVATAWASEVVAVDINPVAVECARRNAQLNGVSSKLDIHESDIFSNVSGRFDLIVFDPPFRWFRPKDWYEHGMADENYSGLGKFFSEVKVHLADNGRVLLAFGSTGDMDHLRYLIGQAEFDAEEIRRIDRLEYSVPVSHFAYRLTKPFRDELLGS